MAINNPALSSFGGGKVPANAQPSNLMRKMIREAPEHVVDEEFAEVLTKARNGCVKSKDFIFRSNIKLVASVVSQSFRYNPDHTVSFDDRFQEGMIGLQRAFDKFDLSLGLRFSTYALHWVRQFIMRGTSEQTGTYGVYLPAHFHGKLARVRRMIREYAKEGKDFLGMSDENIIRAYNASFETDGGWKSGLELNESNIRQMRDFINGASISADSTTKGWGDEADGEMCLWDFLDTKKAIDQFTGKDRFEAARTLDTLYDSLNEREMFVIHERFFSERTLDEIGQEIGVTRERVRQIEASGLKKMNRRDKSNGVGVYNGVVKIDTEFRMRKPRKKFYNKKSVDMGDGMCRARSPEQAKCIEDVARLRSEGKSKKEICETLGITPSKYNYIAFGRNRYTRLKEQQARELKEQRPSK